MTTSDAALAALNQRCALLRALHVPGAPLVLPNAWDVASAKAVIGAGFPVVATTSAGVAQTLGYEDGQDAPPDEMFAAAARIARAVDAPVTVDAEAGYGLEPGEFVDRLLAVGAAGCNLEDTDHAADDLLDTDRQADWLSAVRQAAIERDYGLVINARIDVFIGEERQDDPVLLQSAVGRARAYVGAGADCVYPISLREPDVIKSFLEAISTPVNIFAGRAPSTADLAAWGVARISYGGSIHRQAMQDLAAYLAAIPRAPAPGDHQQPV